MNILLFKTSNRSVTQTLSDLFVECCRNRGHEVTEVTFTESMQHCTGCKACVETSKCVMKDALSEINFSSYKAIVICSPIYFFSLSSRAELFLNRLYCVPLHEKVMGFILPHGSDKDEHSGLDLMMSRIRRISRYCQCRIVAPFEKTTYDRSHVQITRADRERMMSMVIDLEAGVNR